MVRINDAAEIRLEDKLRKKVFAHYDCQSMSASLRPTPTNGSSGLNKRRNTTTGASAASLLGRDINGADPEADAGDGRSNELVLNCPFFRNELGGEEERSMALSRMTSRRSTVRSTSIVECVHTPGVAAGLSLLEDANESRWRVRGCPYSRAGGAAAIENVDSGAAYYRLHFYGLEHENWIGIDENLGPVAISIRKERLAQSSNSYQVKNSGDQPWSLTKSGAENQSSNNSNGRIGATKSPPIKHQYRLIIRTSELQVLRGCVYEDCVPSLANSRHQQHSNQHAKEVLEYVAPELNLSTLRLAVSTADEQLLKLDEQVMTNTYKVGVLLCRAGQRTEEDMYSNEHSSPAFEQFLNLLGNRVRLKGFEKYRAGLDNKSDTTGFYSVYTTFAECQIMFHVSTLLPYMANNKQQLLRKRHIGNDIVTIVFQEPGALPFTPSAIRSHFQHVFIVVRLLEPLPGVGGTGTTGPRYAVSISRSKDVPVFGPPIPKGGVFAAGHAFQQFMWTKIINAENAAHRSEKFITMARRTRNGYLLDMAENYVSNTTLSDVSCSGSGATKLVTSIFGGKKRTGRDRSKEAVFIGRPEVRGSVVWEVSVKDYGSSRHADCLLGISGDTLVLIEESTCQVLFACPCASILGWTSHTNDVVIFFHQGECIFLESKDADLDEIVEIVNRLKVVTGGCETQELILKRNNFRQLGFHVGGDGIVSEVEQGSFAWGSGLRKNWRIVEICKVPVASLNADQMADLLKTSVTVTVTVLPPRDDGEPRRGCNLKNCSYLSYQHNSSIMYDSQLHRQHQQGQSHALDDLSCLKPLRTRNYVGGGIGSDYENLSFRSEMFKPKHHEISELSRHRLVNSSFTPTDVRRGTIAAPIALSISHSSKSLPVSPDQENSGDQQHQPQPSGGQMSIPSLCVETSLGRLTPFSSSSSPRMYTSARLSPYTTMSSASDSMKSSFHTNFVGDFHHNSNSMKRSDLSRLKNSTIFASSNSIAQQSTGSAGGGCSSSERAAMSNSGLGARSFFSDITSGGGNFRRLGNLIVSRSELSLNALSTNGHANKMPDFISPGPVQPMMTSNSSFNPAGSGSERATFGLSSNGMMSNRVNVTRPNAFSASKAMGPVGGLSPNSTLSSISSTSNKSRANYRSFKVRSTKPSSLIGNGGSGNVGVGGNSGVGKSSSASNLKENLLKLIDPEYKSDGNGPTGECDSSPPVSLSSTNKHVSNDVDDASSATSDFSINPSSLTVSNGHVFGVKKSNGADDILTMARPAQVVSSDPPSPLPNEPDSTLRSSRPETVSRLIGEDVSGSSKFRRSELMNSSFHGSSSMFGKTQIDVGGDDYRPMSGKSDKGLGIGGGNRLRSRSRSVTLPNVVGIGSGGSTFSSLAFSEVDDSSGGGGGGSTGGNGSAGGVSSGVDGSGDVDSDSESFGSDMDWPSLVDTATKAIAQVGGDSSIGGSMVDNELDRWVRDFGGDGGGAESGVLTNESVKNLEQVVKKLTSDLVREQTDKACLQQEVEKLKEENLRLLQQSQSLSSVELKKFSQWFSKV